MSEAWPLRERVVVPLFESLTIPDGYEISEPEILFIERFAGKIELGPLTDRGIEPGSVLSGGRRRQLVLGVGRNTLEREVAIVHTEGVGTIAALNLKDLFAKVDAGSLKLTSPQPKPKGLRRILSRL